MTNVEFSNQFDVLYNNIMSNQAPGLDDYEKSVFLTMAQEDIVNAYFNPKSNKLLEGFDNSAQRQVDFSAIIAVETFTDFDEYTPEFDTRDDGVKAIAMPSDIMMVVGEKLEVIRDSNRVILNVVPLNYIEYERQMSKPYKRPTQYQAWRISDGGVNLRRVTLIAGPNDEIAKYTIRYVKKPQAIILADLGNITIDGKSTPQECILDSSLHPDILKRAVELAKAAYIGDMSTQVALGSNSGTELGIIPTQSR